MEKAKSFFSSLLSGGDGASAQGEPAAAVSSIYVYPIKSCRGISLSHAPVSSTGLQHQKVSSIDYEVSTVMVLVFMPDPELILKLRLSLNLPKDHNINRQFCDQATKYLQLFFSATLKRFRWDRQWLVVNSKGRAYTQRVEPKLALVEIEMPTGAFDDGWEPSVDSYIVIKAPGMDPLKVPLVAEHAIADEVSVWEWSGPAHDEGIKAADWFSTYLGKPSRLVRFMISSEIRPVDVKYAQGYNVHFSDGYPFLVASQGSLNAVNEALLEPISINRFRPNIVVDGCNPFSEDLWKDIKINNLTFHGVKLCARCKVPTINQENGVAGTEPTESMKKFRSDYVLRPTCKQKGLVYFGQNMVCPGSLQKTTKGKLVKVGDPVYVVREYASCDVVPA